MENLNMERKAWDNELEDVKEELAKLMASMEIAMATLERIESAVEGNGVFEAPVENRTNPQLIRVPLLPVLPELPSIPEKQGNTSHKLETCVNPGDDVFKHNDELLDFDEDAYVVLNDSGNLLDDYIGFNEMVGGIAGIDVVENRSIHRAFCPNSFVVDLGGLKIHCNTDDESAYANIVDKEFFDENVNFDDGLLNLNDEGHVFVEMNGDSVDASKSVGGRSESVIADVYSVKSFEQACDVKNVGEMSCSNNHNVVTHLSYDEIHLCPNLFDPGGIRSLCSAVSSISPRIRADNDLEESIVTAGECFLVSNGELHETSNGPVNCDECVCVVDEYTYPINWSGKSAKNEASLILNNEPNGNWLHDLSGLKIYGVSVDLIDAIDDVLGAAVIGAVFVHLFSRNSGINGIVGELLNIDMDDFVYAKTGKKELVNELIGDAFRENLFSRGIGLNMFFFDPGGLKSIAYQLNVNKETIMVKKDEEILHNLHFDFAGLNPVDDVREVHEHWCLVVTCFKRSTMVLQIQQHYFIIFVRMKLFKQMVSQAKLANCFVKDIKVLGFSDCNIKFIANHEVHAIEFEDPVMTFWFGTLHMTFFIEDRGYCKQVGLSNLFSRL